MQDVGCSGVATGGVEAELEGGGAESPEQVEKIQLVTNPEYTSGSVERINAYVSSEYPFGSVMHLIMHLPQGGLLVLNVAAATAGSAEVPTPITSSIVHELGSGVDGVVGIGTLPEVEPTKQVARTHCV